MLSKEAVEKFKNLYWKRFKEKLSDDEAYQKSNRLLGLYRTIYDSISLEQIKGIINLNEDNDRQS